MMAISRGLPPLTLVAESPDYGGTVRALTALDPHVYCAGVTTRKVWQLDPADMSKVAESANYGNTVYALTALGSYVYCAGYRKVWQLTTEEE